MADTRYIVKQNDTLWDISQKLLGDPNKWPSIFKHNNTPEIIKITGKAITNEDVIFVGQVLYIPEQQVANKSPSAQPVRYAHFKSKAQQYENFKNSVLCKVLKPQLPGLKLAVFRILQPTQKKKKIMHYV